jgi:putative intracellular protease/amidase
MHDAVLTDRIKARSQEAELVLSVCTGALLLARAGPLDGLEATTHYGAIDLLRQVAPKTTVHADRRFVDNGRVICSAGVAVAEVYAALLDFDSYPRWWPAQLRVRVLKVTPARVGSRIEIRPRGGQFICEIGAKTQHPMMRPYSCFMAS